MANFHPVDQVEFVDIDTTSIGIAETLIARWMRLEQLLEHNRVVRVEHEYQVTHLYSPIGPINTLNSVVYGDDEEDITSEVYFSSTYPRWVLLRNKRVPWACDAPVTIDAEVGFLVDSIPNALTLATKLVAENIVDPEGTGDLNEITLRDLSGKLDSPEESATFKTLNTVYTLLKPYMPPLTWAGTPAQMMAGRLLDDGA